jgi:uncharacterized protein
MRYRIGQESTMKLTDELTGPANAIRGFSPGAIRIGEQTFNRSCIVAANALITDWPPQSIAELRIEHLDAVLALRPEIVLLGTGLRQQFPDRQLLASMLARRVGIEVMDTGAACRTYNVLMGEQRRVIAALFLT